MNDRILIVGLDVFARIGVPDQERESPQRLEIDLALEADFREAPDDIAFTTDYAEVASWVIAECVRVEFRLLESLAEHLAAGLLARFPRVTAAEIEIRKFVLPGARHAGVRVRRERPAAAESLC